MASAAAAAAEFQELMPGAVCSFRNAFTKAECDSFIEKSERAGYTKATITIEGKEKQDIVAAEVRNNDRAIIDDQVLAEDIWNRVKISLPTQFSTQGDGTAAVSISNRLRFYRYDEGQRFVRHLDGYEYGSMIYDQKNLNAPQARLTCLLYLNEGFEGGNTTFFSSKGKEILAAKPEIGKVLIFTQHLLHEGSVVVKGRKYVIRTDVMFAKPPADSGQQAGWTCVVS